MVSSSPSSPSSDRMGVARGGAFYDRSHAVTQFQQKYESKEQLGKGLSSVVRRCVNKHTGEEFAVKIIDLGPDDLIDEEGLNQRQLVTREIEILHRVSGHKNIVSLIETFEGESVVFLVFELCRRGELFDYLTSEITISERRTKYIMRQVFQAVLHCHKLNVVHRDLKPENILLDEDLNVKLTDFGFAKVLQGGEKLHEVCGTPGYLAPEMLKAGMLERSECPGYSFAIDSWACGIIFYTLIAGAPPFWHRKQVTLIRLILEGRFSFSTPEWQYVSKDVKYVIAELLRVEPEKRISIEIALNNPCFNIIVNSETQQPPSSTTQATIPVPPCNTEIIVTPDQTPSSPSFIPRRKLRAVFHLVRLTIRLRRLVLNAEPLSFPRARVAPYTMHMFRKVIDNTAFRIYGHWVKRGEGQNRAALFEHFPKKEEVKKQQTDAEEGVT